MKRMAILFLTIFVLAMLLFGGCSFGKRIDTLRDWSFQYNAGAGDYSIFFGLTNSEGNPVAADAEVKIRIESDKGEILFEGVDEVSEEDFGMYETVTEGEKYLAEIRIGMGELTKGTSVSGTVYLTVSNEKLFSFEEVECDAYACLPVSPPKVSLPELPRTLMQYGVFGEVESGIEIQSLTYTYDPGFGRGTLYFTILGQKTYEGDAYGAYDMIRYRLCDESGTELDSGQILFGPNLKDGDKFTDESLILYDIEPGKEYTLELLNYEY